MARQHRVVDRIVEQLAGTGVDYIFGVDGANIEDLYDAAHFQSGITAILAKHEFSAATMADGYSRSGAGLGVVAATSGGGALNLVAGLGESLASRVPVLALVGQAATSMDGRGSFQDTSGRNGALNAEALFAAVSVFCRRVLAPADIVSALPDAIAAARAGGPAVLLLPKDVQQGLVRVDGYIRHLGREIDPAGPLLGDPHPILQALRRATGPVTIIAGEQVARDDAREELEALRFLLRARIACVPDAKDVAGTPGFGSSSALGVTGVIGHPGVGEAVAASSLCLVVGTRLGVMARAGLEDALAMAPTISIGSAPPYLPCTHVHTDNLRVSLSTLTRALSGKGRPRGLRVPDMVSSTELRPPAFTGPGVRYRDAMIALDRALPAGVDIVVDAGNTGAAAVHHLRVRRGGRFAVALGMGGMGYSFGAGIGMAFGRVRSARAKRTVVIAGDGAFFMHGMEIHTAVHYRLPITFVLFNNNAHAMCVTREQLFYDDLYSYNRFAPSFLGAGCAAMFPGLSSVDVTDPEELPAALARAMAVEGPSVVSVVCAADEIPPFAPFLTQRPTKHGLDDEISTPKENPTDVPARA
ncbi:thiamine pyrophosphate-binding protein [Mycolicibacter sinensis]|uniref:acetolactate synthase n=1 Tax=Mycolicibacter sinensis (strain JDM601) TaxID=875328 RepID=A0A1A2NQH4_MYCSD|nr:thiamine pyrophosphate-binding protein [Mycolicibacter sinensis]OBH17324.1 acetolactate synthase [Mycolicibacter sinensis]OBI32250.1 acetolactate synthase [Mycolicibacter sinensis]